MVEDAQDEIEAGMLLLPAADETGEGGKAASNEDLSKGRRGRVVLSGSLASMGREE